MKNINEFGIALSYTIVIPPPHITTYICDVSYENPSRDYCPEYKDYYTAHTVCKNKFT